MTVDGGCKPVACLDALPVKGAVSCGGGPLSCCLVTGELPRLRAAGLRKQLAEHIKEGNRSRGNIILWPLREAALLAGGTCAGPWAPAEDPVESALSRKSPRAQGGQKQLSAIAEVALGTPRGRGY